MIEAAAADARAVAAERILRESGVTQATVRTAGHEEEIAVVSTPAAYWPRLLGADGRPTVQAVKALGFRYVTIDLDPPVP